MGLLDRQPVGLPVGFRWHRQEQHQDEGAEQRDGEPLQVLVPGASASW
jgi:hypothetical protein